jgi:hypothetical protein
MAARGADDCNRRSRSLSRLANLIETGFTLRPGSAVLWEGGDAKPAGPTSVSNS